MELVWKARYAGKGGAQLETDRVAIDAKISEVATPLLMQMFKDGRAEYVGPFTRRYRNTPEEIKAISAVQMRPNDGIYRAILPPDEYPDLYELRAESLWLDRMIDYGFVQATGK